ncbi:MULTISPECIES: hypothetical protein [Aeromonas]|nr:hypothetical protein [Aeromonas dhakensis]
MIRTSSIQSTPALWELKSRVVGILFSGIADLVQFINFHKQEKL